jgi:large subunit ribosomal protein L21
MYAVLTTGGKQYRVEAGSELLIERVPGDAGSSITFDRVLLVGDGDAVTVGTPTIDGATVSATVLGEALGPKLAVFKFKQKVKYRRMAGHRQHLLRVRIDEISAAGRRSKADTAEAPAEDKPKRARATAAKAAAATEEKPKRTRTTAAKPKATAGATEEKPKRARASSATKKPAAKKKPAKAEE